VVQADGKGVPILRAPAAAPAAGTPTPLRLGKGQKRGGKKEATLTAIYTIAPAVRTPEAVVESLFHDASEQGDADDADAAGREREGPQHKRLWTRLPARSRGVTDRTSPRASPDRWQSGAVGPRTPALPDAPLVLNLIHATEYL
jgi:hypothetical protein